MYWRIYRKFTMIFNLLSVFRLIQKFNIKNIDIFILNIDWYFALQILKLNFIIIKIKFLKFNSI